MKNPEPKVTPDVGRQDIRKKLKDAMKLYPEGYFSPEMITAITEEIHDKL